MRAQVRDIAQHRGGLPSSTSRSMSTGSLPKCAIRDDEAMPGRCAPTTANGQRSRSQMARKRASRPAGSPARSVPALRCTRFRAAPSRLFVGDGAQIEARPAPPPWTSSGQRIGKAAGADIVDGQDRIGCAQLPAAVDDLLRPPLHLGVAALNGIEIEIGGIRAGRHRRRRAAAEPDQHAGSAELDQQRSFGNGLLLHMRGGDIAETAGDHDRLVIAARSPATTCSNVRK